MARTVHTIRRSIRAALHAGRSLVTAVRGWHYGLLVRLYAAIDTGATVRIGYRDADGVTSSRSISPHRFQVSAAGRIIIRAYDHRDGEDTSFRTDRISTFAA